MLMKIILRLSVALVLIPFPGKAQHITCQSFCVTNIQLDPVTLEEMLIDIYFAGEPDDFINYPYVSLVTNTAGDTLGTGSLNFFGQFGNSTQTYVVDKAIDSLPDNFEAVVYFHYDTVECVLVFPCSTTAVKNVSGYNDILLYPNPMTSGTIIQSPGMLSGFSIVVYNAFGQFIQQLETGGGKPVIFPRRNLPAGLYYILFCKDDITVTKKIIIID